MKDVLAIAILIVAASVRQTCADQIPDSTSADTTQLITENLRSAGADSVYVARSPSIPQVDLNEDLLFDIDHEEFGDWMAVLPGFYPLDQAGLGAPYRGLILGLKPSATELQFRGRSFEDHLWGSADLGWIPPEALIGIRFRPLALSAAGGRIDARLRSLEPVPPSSRVAVRDGYYGLGTVDFDLVQKIAPRVVFNGGGRVATYGGRFINSEGYDLNLRTEVAFRLNSAIYGWGGLMQGKQNAQIPGSSGSYNRDRYEMDLAGQYRSTRAHLFGIQQRESYRGGPTDGWDEIGCMGDWDLQGKAAKATAQLRLSTARWRLKNLSWSSTVFGSAKVELQWPTQYGISGLLLLGLDLSDDFAPARHLGLAARTLIKAPLSAFVSVSQHQVQPTRFEWAADFQPGEHYLPYDPALLQNPDLPVQGDRSLKPETYTTVATGLEIESDHVNTALEFFWRRTENPIFWLVENGTVLKPHNSATDESAGAVGWLLCRPLSQLDLGITGSLLPHDSGDKSLFPKILAHAWTQFHQNLFRNELELRFRLGADYWGERQAPVPGAWEEWGDVLVVNGRISAYLLGAQLFWGTNNIFSQDYKLFPGYLMMHKEEVWGVAWNFRD